jgi:hypothetical protein
LLEGKYTMNALTKSYLASIVALSLALFPAQAAQNKALGVILEAQDARIGSSPTSAGSSIYLGDILNTDENGRIRVRVGQTVYEILSDSSVAFYPGQTSPIAELRHGAILVSNNSPTEDFQIYASDVRIISDSQRPISGQVSLRTPCELEVSSQIGLMEVIAGKDKRTVEHDHAYRVIPEHSVDPRDATVSPEDPNYHQNHSHAGCAAALAQNAGKAPLAAGHSYFIPIAVGVVAGIAIIPIIKSFESPDRP